jgi:hypothetical protein
MPVGCFVGRVQPQYLQLYVRGGEDAAADDKRDRAGREHPESSIYNHVITPWPVLTTQPRFGPNASVIERRMAGQAGPGMTMAPLTGLLTS